jgi:hypothetical protein
VWCIKDALPLFHSSQNSHPWKAVLYTTVLFAAPLQVRAVAVSCTRLLPHQACHPQGHQAGEPAGEIEGWEAAAQHVECQVLFALQITRSPATEPPMCVLVSPVGWRTCSSQPAARPPYRLCWTIVALQQQARHAWLASAHNQPRPRFCSCIQAP